MKMKIENVGNIAKNDNYKLRDKTYLILNLS